MQTIFPDSVFSQARRAESLHPEETGRMLFMLKDD